MHEIGKILGRKEALPLDPPICSVVILLSVADPGYPVGNPNPMEALSCYYLAYLFSESA